MDTRAFQSLIAYLEKVPAIDPSLETGTNEEGYWWIKFQIDIHNDYAWNVVQELACVVNYLSINDQVSLNGVALLIKDIEAEILCFELYPNTLSKTNFGETQVGDLLNIEVDPIIVKIARIFEKINH